ncbi:MAG: molybdopterin-dependent oxidoreductase [Stenomitos rutilans HA7619-LM2]|jgi:DMSO/TMAO reductase YedYZ molybdopterin-dependent catalytic subunit|nr:molybdopterin-dependent oxidoreductase [Stenomitos rutilans HA7619-LM2]
MNTPQMMTATGQAIEVRRPIHDANNSATLASTVYQRLAAAPAAAVLFCISGDMLQPVCFTAADLAKLPRTTLTVRERKGTNIAYEGVLLREILQRAGVPQNEQLRGSNLARYLVVEGADGYAVVFGLPEFDPAFGNRVVLLADRRDGQALAPDEAPLRLVIPDDQRRARWVRKITRMRVMRATVTP